MSVMYSAGPDCTASPFRLMSRRRAIAALCAIPMLGRSAYARTEWPARPVRIILGQPAGSGSDPLARGLAPHLQTAFGQPFFVENMPGGAGNTAAVAIAHATDHHTIGVVLGGPTTTAKALNPNLAYDPAKDFRPISLLTRVPFVLTVSAKSFAGARFADVIDQARARPGQFSYASIGAGTTTHLAMEEIKAALGIDLVHVPYRGFPQATLDLLEGRVQMMFNVPATATEHVATGRLVAVAQTGARRLPNFADVPTLGEIGAPIKPFFGWSGLIAPANFPEDAALRISQVVGSALSTDPAARGGLDRFGNEILGTGPDELRVFQASEAARWGAVITRLGIKAGE